MTSIQAITPISTSDIESHETLQKVYEAKQGIFTGVLRVLESRGFTREFIESELNEQQVREFEACILGIKDNLDDMFFHLINELEKDVKYRAGQEAGFQVKSQLAQIREDCSTFMQGVYECRRGEV